MDLREVPETSFRRHPWERARARYFSQILRTHVAFEHPVRILDVGAGDGYLAEVLSSKLPSGSEYTCVDPHYTDAQLRDFQAGASARLRFEREAPPGRWDLITLLDVLEHVEDDAALLDGFVDKSLEPGGYVLISVPAFMWLYSSHDAFLGHHRRYSMARLTELAGAAGIEIVRRGGLFYGLLLVRAAQRLGEVLGRKPGPGDGDVSSRSELASWEHGAFVTGLVDFLLATDNAVSRLLAWANLPLPGLSIWLLGRKR